MKVVERHRLNPVWNWKAIEEGDNGNDESIAHYIAEVLIKQITSESEKVE